MRTRTPRGFTLIELMVVVCIVGLLSSVALPMYSKSTLRARAAERATILQSMRMAIEDAYVRNLIPAGGSLIGADNPAGAAGTTKRSFDNGAAGWRDISIVVQGDCYYTYHFEATESANGVDAVYWSQATGDLDGDGVPTYKRYTASRYDGHWNKVDALSYPPDGQEDDAFYHSF
jgi:prepilin-type N-terminal cleavage/methylation domain-containing protein